MCIFISPEAASQKNKQTKNKDKYIARKIYNTISVATLRIHYGNRETELFQWLRIYIHKNVSYVYVIWITLHPWQSGEGGFSLEVAYCDAVLVQNAAIQYTATRKPRKFAWYFRPRGGGAPAPCSPFLATSELAEYHCAAVISKHRRRAYEKPGAVQRAPAPPPPSKNPAPPVAPMKFMIKHNLSLARGGLLWQYRSVPPPAAIMATPLSPPSMLTPEPPLRKTRPL